jgi:hypothetical protein
MTEIYGKLAGKWYQLYGKPMDVFGMVSNFSCYFVIFLISLFPYWQGTKFMEWITSLLEEHYWFTIMVPFPWIFITFAVTFYCTKED